MTNPMEAWFPFKYKWLFIINMLSDDDIAKLCRAVSTYLVMGSKDETLPPHLAKHFDDFCSSMEEDKAKKNELSEKRRENGRKGANARHSKANAEQVPGNCQANAEQMPSNCQAIAEQNLANFSTKQNKTKQNITIQDQTDIEKETVTVNTEKQRERKETIENISLVRQEPYSPVRKPRKSSVIQYDNLFRWEEFWEAYPKKAAKEKTYSTWVAMEPSDGLIDTILEDIEARKHSRQWTDEDGRYIPNPMTYLNAEKWTERKTASRPRTSLEWCLDYIKTEESK